MNIVCYSKDGEECRRIVSVLEGQNHKCTVFTDEVKFLFSLAEQGVNWDVLVLDFQSIPHYSFNIFNHLNRSGFIIPVVFYNDPLSPVTDKASYWLRINENMYFSKYFDKYFSVFNLIEKALSCFASCEKASDSQPLNLELMRQKSGFTPKMFRLFKFFYKKRGRQLSVKELSDFLFEKKEISCESIYTYISRLRKILLKEKLVKIDIVRTAFASYQMIIKN